MQQLSAIDASFLYAEAPHQPMHIGSLTICDPSTAPDGIVRFKDIIQQTIDVAHLLPHTYRRLIEVPFNFDFPYWINDPDFDAEFHVRHIALPKPGDWRQLCIQVARLHSRSLDRNRPLWELYVIEGLDHVDGIPPGSFALLSKIHHSCIDGAGTAQAGIDAANWSQSDSKELRWQADSVPRPETLLAKAHLNALAKPFEYASFLQRTAPTMYDYMSKLSRGEIKAPPKAPQTRFNRGVSTHRVFEGVIFNLQRVKQLKREVGGTVNDVMLAICSGGLRRYLEHHGELPEDSLVTECPINVRNASEAQGSNMVLDMHVPLRTDIADVKQRAVAICQETQDAKERFQAVGAKTMMEAASFLTPGLSIMGSRVATEKALQNIGNPVFNCVTTNVPGSPKPVDVLGAKIIRDFGTGPVMDGCGLFHSITSYCDEIGIAVTACREMMPDPSFYADCLRESFAELEAVFWPNPTVSNQSVQPAIEQGIEVEKNTVETEKSSATDAVKSRKPLAKRATARKTVVKKSAAKNSITKKPTAKKASEGKTAAMKVNVDKSAVHQDASVVTDAGTQEQVVAEKN